MINFSDLPSWHSTLRLELSHQLVLPPCCFSHSTAADWNRGCGWCALFSTASAFRYSSDAGWVVVARTFTAAYVNGVWNFVRASVGRLVKEHVPYGSKADSVRNWQYKNWIHISLRIPWLLHSHWQKRWKVTCTYPRLHRDIFVIPSNYKSP